MSFFSFLVQYYVWIMIVLIILVVTVIGFLVDNKTKENEKSDLSHQKKMLGSNSSTKLNSEDKDLESFFDDDPDEVSQSKTMESSTSMGQVRQEVAAPVVSDVAQTQVNADVFSSNVDTPNASAVAQTQSVSTPTNTNVVSPKVVVSGVSQSQSVSVQSNVNTRVAAPVVSDVAQTQPVSTQSNVNTRVAAPANSSVNTVQSVPVQSNVNQTVNSSSYSNGLNDIFTTDGSKPFDINSMFSNNK